MWGAAEDAAPTMIPPESRKSALAGLSWRRSPAAGVQLSVKLPLAFKIAAEELGLTDLALQIVWFSNKCDQDETRKAFLSGDPEVFSDVPGFRGFISWTNVLQTGNVNLATQWHNAPVARVVCHELRHVQQRIQYGEDEPSSALNGELERDADDYAADFWERHKRRFRP